MASVRFLFFIAFAFLSGCSDKSVDFAAEEFTLDNGVRLVVLPDTRFDIITQMVWYPTGSGDERISKTGLAHLVEHLMFQHEPHLKQGGFSSLIERLGGEDNAFTSYDYTAYYQRFHPDQINKIMQLESERMTALLLNPQSVRKERKVVMEEFYQRQRSNPLTPLHNKMQAALYSPTHPYGRPVIGSLKDIASLDKTDVENFHQSFYAPQQALILIAGKIDPDDAFKLANQFYGNLETLPAKETADFPPVLERQSKPPLLLHVDKGARQAVFLRYITTTNRHILGPRGAASFEVLTQLLVGSPQAKLSQLFITETKLASFVGGGLDIDRRGPGKFSIQMWLNPQKRLTKKLIRTFYQKLDSLLADLATGKVRFSEAELVRAKNHLVADGIYLKDNNFHLANFVGAWLTTGHSLESAQSWPTYIQAVQLEDVQRAAQQLLNPERAVSGFLLPKK